MGREKEDTEKKDILLSGAELVNPYNGDQRKGEQVEEMFDSIAPAYDFMNTAMTLGLHRYWRNRALRDARRLDPDPRYILDVATGTGDVAFRLARTYPQARIVGVDLSSGMLKIAKDRLKGSPEEMRKRMKFETGDSLLLRFSNNSFDLVTVAYGVRNFQHLRQGLAEMYRVLRPGGVLCVIELSVPKNPVAKWGYNLYSRHLIPALGRLISGDSRAYTYLPESIAAAPQRDDMTAILKECGFVDTRWHSLTCGAVTYYLGIKK